MRKLLHYFSALISLLFVTLLSNQALSQCTTSNGVTICTFDASGSWTVPCGVTSVTVQAWGGGGGGAGDGSNATTSGGGGGGGGYSTSSISVTPGTLINFTVGAGGPGGSGNANGTLGGTSTFSTVSAPGGGGGLFAGGGGTGGIGTSGTGNAGGDGVATGAGGAGGNAAGGGGLGGLSNGVGNSGLPGGVPGGGGSGGDDEGGGTRDGGAGGAGRIIITYTTPFAGLDQTLPCGVFNTTLSANTQAIGTGTWSVVSGTGVVFGNVNSPTSTVSYTSGCATLRWTWSGAGCTSISDDVVICTDVTSLCNDNPCNAAPLTVTSGTCVLTTGNNTGSTYSTGMSDPPCAVVNGPDVWYSIVVPPSGQVQISADAGGTFDEMITLYDGSCSNLQFAGCVSGVASNAYPLTYAGVPGSTIYLRVNEGETGDASTGSFGICAYEATTAGVSQVLPGVTTTVTCGSTLNFYDTGGQGGTVTVNTSQPPPAGNYTNNTGTTWTICPDDPTQYVTISFSQFLLETGFDKMIITSGTNNVIAQWTGNQGQGDIVSAQNPGECLIVYFQSDYSFTALGWEAVVSCQPTMSPSQINNECSVNNCTGGCGIWVCADGTYNTVAGAGAGIDEINEVTGGCWGAAGEVATSWFYFTTSTSGLLSFEFVPSNNGHNINFALYGPTTNGVPPCPTTTGDAPIRCSFTDMGGSRTGLRAGESDLYDGPFGNSFAAPLQVSPGQTYALVVDVYQNGQPPTQTTIDFTGAAGLDCAVLLPIELISFEGINQNEKNVLSWVTASQLNNDFFTIERSIDGQKWEVAGTVNGAGTTNHTMFYTLDDFKPYFPVTYYRLKQTDTDGKGTYVKTISVTNRKNLDGEFVSNLFPNPSSGYATFSFNGFDTKTPLNVSIVNGMGEVITNVSYTSLYREMPITLITSNLSNGVYQVIFTQGENKQVQKLSIIK
jgi:hypothetical protein